jgi:putative oxidoreductase
MSLALFVLRIVVGVLFVGHGAQKLFGSFGGHGPEGTGQFFEQLGYRPGKRHAVLAGMAELGGGLLLALGLLTPLATAIIIGVMVNAIGSVHARNGPWVTNGGYEYPLVIIAAMYAVAATGPGVASIDHALGLSLQGTTWGLISLAVGLASGAIVLSLRKPVPEPEPEVAPESAEPRETRAGEGRASAPLTAEETLELGG